MVTYVLGVPDVDAVVVENQQFHVAATRSELDLPDPTAMSWNRSGRQACHFFKMCCVKILLNWSLIWSHCNLHCSTL